MVSDLGYWYMHVLVWFWNVLSRFLSCQNVFWSYFENWFWNKQIFLYHTGDHTAIWDTRVGGMAMCSLFKINILVHMISICYTAWPHTRVTTKGHGHFCATRSQRVTWPVHTTVWLLFSYLPLIFWKCFNLILICARFNLRSFVSSIKTRI